MSDYEQSTLWKNAFTHCGDGMGMRAHEPALMAESALAKDWLNPEEDAAWAHLQPGK